MQAWSESLGDISYPLLSDFYPHGHVAETYGVLLEDGRCERAIFVIDKKGIIRYIDIHDIDEQPDNEVLFQVLHELEPDAKQTQSTRIGSGAQSAAGTPPVDMGPEVVLYCTSWCPSCRRARIYLKSHRIAFTEIDITNDREAAARVRGWADGYETSPTLDINGTIVVNFDRDRLDEVFGFED